MSVFSRYTSVLKSYFLFPWYLYQVYHKHLLEGDKARISADRRIKGGEGNTFILVQKDGTRISNPDIKGLEIEFLGKGALVEIGEGCLFTNTKFICGPEVRIKLADRVRIYGRLSVYATAAKSNLKIGRNTVIGEVDISLRDEQGHSVLIGENCLFGWGGVSFRTTDGHTIFNLSDGQPLNYGGDIILGNHIWVGRSVCFLKHASVASDSVIGAHSLVTKAFSESNVVIAGFPARVIRKNISWAEQNIEEYLARRSKSSR